MEKDQKSEEGKECCSSGGSCRSGCGGCKCLMAVVLLLLGGVVGYLMGSHCAMRKGMNCPYSMQQAPAPGK